MILRIIREGYNNPSLINLIFSYIYYNCECTNSVHIKQDSGSMSKCRRKGETNEETGN